MTDSIKSKAEVELVRRTFTTESCIHQWEEAAARAAHLIT